MGKCGGVYRVLVGKPEGKRPLRRPKPMWEDNIKMDLQEVRFEGMNWIDVAQERGRWRALVNAVMNIRFPKMRGISCLADNWLASEEGLCSMEGV